MESHSSNNKRIFKNTIILYVRMVIVLLITLYTSRIVLKALGVDDFGLYNVVGGVIGLLSFFNVTMARSTQRFLNVSMVKGEKTLSEVFESSITVHLLFALLFFFVGETIGLWFLNSQIIIPEGRELAAIIVYHASIVSFCISIISIPYYAAIISYERMSFVAIVSIIDAVLKLCIAWLLLVNNSDRLVLYGILLSCVSVVNLLLYVLYCRVHYPFLRFRTSYNKDNFKQIFSFVSWTLMGESAQVGCNQGNVVLVNTFHSLSANAAMTIGSQINNALYNLTSNFQTAFNPQITKSYAEGNYDYLKKLVFTTSKISFCILFIVALPVSFNINWLLNLWLTEVPPLSNVFAILFLINALLNAISAPFHFVVLSAGQIKYFQIVSSIIYLIDLPLVYIFFRLGMPAPTVLWVKIGTMVAIIFVRIIYAERAVPSINLIDFVIKVMLPLAIISGISVYLAFFLDRYAYSLGSRLAYTIVLLIISGCLLWTISLDKNEKYLLLSYLKIKKKNLDVV